MWYGALVDNCLPAADAFEVDPNGELASDEELWVGQQNQGTGVTQQAHIAPVRAVRPGAASVEKLACQADCWMIMDAEAVGVGAAHRETAEGVESVQSDRDR